MTLKEMMKVLLVFLFMTLLYMFMLIPIFFILFHEIAQPCVNIERTLIFLYDSTLGVFDYEQVPYWSEYNLRWVVAVTFHVVIANLFLLNYLISALSTIYEEVYEIGDF
jgi:hypothetical protein